MTNVLWFSALALPVVVAGSQLHRLARTGKTLPKAWLGLQVVALDHPVPGYWRAFVREGDRALGHFPGGSLPDLDLAAEPSRSCRGWGALPWPVYWLKA